MSPSKRGNKGSHPCEREGDTLPSRHAERIEGPSLVTPTLLEARRDLCDVPQARRSFAQVAHKPPSRRRLELRRPALGVQVDELKRVLERQVREFACGVLGGSGEDAPPDLSAPEHHRA
jgi:hypothetical protein